ncbi:hypothetical protein ABPG75_001793 [Micractinium tetrahymenae]
MPPQLSKTERQALLAQLAAKRKGGRALDSLEDSDHESSAAVAAEDDSDGDDSFATARSRQVVVLDDSSEDENGGANRGGATSRLAPGGGLRRLHKAGHPAPAPPRQQQPQQRDTQVITIEDSEEEGEEEDGGSGAGADDIAAQLGGLSIKGKPGRGAGAGAGTSRLLRRDAEPPAPAVSASSSDSNCLVLSGRGEFKLNAKASTMLYPHQVEGVRWLWSLYCRQRGGILADDMGLGKTIQCAAFLAGLIESRLIRRAIVVAPKTLLAQWRKELDICGLGSAAAEYGGTANERAAALDRVVRRRGVLLTTYGMVLHNAEVLGSHDAHDPDEGPMWDVMICDEGHKLKNPRMQLRKQLDAVPVALRIIISGTPIQNNLLEMWALFNFCAPDVLGSASDFKDQYERTITNGSDKHATQYERERGAVAAARLRQEIGPYMLRREKKEVFKPAGADNEQQNTAQPGASGTVAEAAAGGAGSTASGGARPAAMPHKNDLIVWLKLKPMQRRVYQAFLNSDSVKKVFNQTASALAAITVLKKVCDHPVLLSERGAKGIISGASRARRQAAARLGGGGLSDSDVEEIEDSSEEEVLESEEGEWESDSEDYSSDDEQAARRRQQARQRKQQKQQQRQQQKAVPAAVGAEGEEDWNLWASTELEAKLLDEVHTTGFAASCKTVFVMALLKNLVEEGHRTLIFSQSRVMLNILESAIREEGWRFCRIDGSVASAAEREARVRHFQTSSSIPIFLLTSQVGGLGLTLTAADRVIILDPAWNPSTDNQSVDRAYRIGQKRDVVVYRLISCGTVEEKIYRRQVFKGGLSRTGMEEGEQFRYFAQQDLRDLFRLELSECESSRTQRELHAMHAHQRRETPELRRHLDYLATLDCYAGVSDHDLLFSKKEREAPPTSITARAEAPSRAAGAAGAGSSPRKGVFGRTAAQGWNGSSELSDLFAKAVTISGGATARSSAAAAAAAGALPPGGGWAGAGAQTGAGAVQQPSPTQRRLSGSGRDPLQERMEQLEELLERKRHLLTLSAGLADGGKRVRSQIAELEQELAEARRAASGEPATSSVNRSSSAVAAATAPVAAVPVAAPPVAAPLPAAAPITTARGLPAKPAGGTRLLTAAAAAPLPSSKPAAPAAAPAVPRAAATAAPAAAPAVAAAAVPKPAAPGSKPAASPLFARMRDMLWGSSSKQQPDGVEASTAAAGAGRALSFGGQPGAPPSVPAAAGPKQAAAQHAQQQQQAQQADRLPPPPQQAAPHQPQAPGAAPPPQQPQAAAAAKAPRPHREVKARLMETLREIKQLEGAGMFDRHHVEKLRRRAARLAAEFQAGKDAEEAAAAGRAS